MTKLWRVRRTVHKMLHDRKYAVSDDDLKRSKESVRGLRASGPGAVRPSLLVAHSSIRLPLVTRPSSRKCLGRRRGVRSSPLWRHTWTTRRTWRVPPAPREEGGLAQPLPGRGPPPAAAWGVTR